MPGLKSMRVELHAIEQMVKQRYQVIGALSIDLLVQESDSVKLFSFYSANDLLVGLDVMSKLFNHMPEYFDQTCHLPLISTVLSSNTKKYDRMIIISGIYRWWNIELNTILDRDFNDTIEHYQSLTIYQTGRSSCSSGSWCSVPPPSDESLVDGENAICVIDNNLSPQSDSNMIFIGKYDFYPHILLNPLF